MNVEVDMAPLVAATGRLAAALASGADAGARAQADYTAHQVAAGVPRRTGRLASTVAAVPDRDGWAVTYGAGLPYARYIEHRSHAVAAGVDGAAVMFTQRMERLADQLAART